MPVGEPGNYLLLLCVVFIISISRFSNSPRFLDNLLKMEETHPGISELFEKGMLSVRRTKKRYSGNYHDLTLEQTVNLEISQTPFRQDKDGQ